MARRRPPMPDYPGSGHCTWCADAIFYPAGHKRAGELNRRRSWHDECVTAYKIAIASDAARSAVWRRDQGACAACGVVAHRMGWINHGEAYWWDDDRKRAKLLGVSSGRACTISWGRIDEWDADHIRPLWSAPADIGLQDREVWFGMSNLQTLCRPCHVEKTAREASMRAEQRRMAA